MELDRAGLGEFLRRARKAKGWDQQDVARRVGMSQGWYSNVERGVADPSGQLDRLAAALDIDLNALIDRMVGMMTEVERAVWHDPLLSREQRRHVLALYGAITGRDSFTKIKVFYPDSGPPDANGASAS